MTSLEAPPAGRACDKEGGVADGGSKADGKSCFNMFQQDFKKFRSSSVDGTPF